MRAETYLKTYSLNPMFPVLLSVSGPQNRSAFSVDRRREKKSTFPFSRVQAHLEQEQNLSHKPHFGFRKTLTDPATVTLVIFV